MRFWAGAKHVSRTFSKAVHGSKPKKLVYISTSADIFENLSLEEWLYENADLPSTEYLLMWRNAPAVVVGRHQNPWTECNVVETQTRGVAVARRNSGGGTVFHDEGNLNLSFLKSRSHYDRRQNLSLVVGALTASWDIDLDLNARDDLILDGVYKVSGTASKLGGQRTYHHFTLMLDVNTHILGHLLHSPLEGVDSKATRSVPALVKNLREAAPEMTAENAIHVISQEFLKDETDKCVHSVDPTDDSRFPGVIAIQQRLKSWEWVYGKTPRFAITRNFIKPSSLSLRPSSSPGSLPTPSSSALQSPQHDSTSDCSVRIHLQIDKGRIHTLSADLSPGCCCHGNASSLLSRVTQLQAFDGQPLEEDEMKSLWDSVQRNLEAERGSEDESLLVWAVKCLKQCMPCPGR